MSTRHWDSPFPSRVTHSLVRRWAGELPTPFYLYDLETLHRRIGEVKSFPHPRSSAFQPRYAIKANSNRHLISILHEAGIAFDASSGFEVERLIKIGVPPAKIILTAQQVPSPDDKFLRFFRRGLSYNATSLRQLEWFGRLYPGGRISLRINPGFGSGENTKTTVGGIDSAFGIWHEYHPDILSLCRRFNLTVERIHTHVGSGSDPEIWGQVMKSSLQLLNNFPSAHILNIGGGFKIGRHPEEKSADLKSIGKNICAQMESFICKHKRPIDLEIEPGTYYIAEAGLLIARVEDIISTGTNHRHHFIKLNCGMNDLIRPTLYHSHHHIDIIPQNPRRSVAKKLPYVVVGHCCESGDQLSQFPDLKKNQKNHQQNNQKAFFSFPIPQPGDLAIIHGTGAYGSAMSSRYNSFPLIAEYLYDRRDRTSGLKLIRRAETLNDVIKKENISS